MKKLVFLFTLCAGYTLSFAAGNVQIFPYPTTLRSTQSDEIDLRGRIEPGEIRRETKAISAFLEGSVIKAQFHFDMGSVQIKIVNESGNNLYTTNVASSLGEVLIPISSLSSGNYSITFTASSGVLTGDFTL
ncbi:DUF3244 domain-containing protein [Sphingobacterium siyangense]|jgi:hypothetical protein|uniref:DUF3244 domain-containing protein n=1 Tax=Sphingobacterium siyangense TaxID=459529 RepID=UPI003C7100CC